MSVAENSTDSFRVDTELQNGAAILTVVGELDLATAPILQDAVDAVRGEATEALVVDLTGVEFLASAGMTVLVQSHQSVPDGVVFSVVATGAATARPLQLVGLDETFPIHASRQDALAATGDARRSDFA
ncbi:MULTISPECIES: STAS domain-containing protein [Nocardiaceae]|uniref:Anti-sigma factor antagonist n=1 Tax=Rhodococcoides kroppenstedtii TaxID=293050 RepID=A0ABS7NQT2_9NOCA|nr:MULTISPECIES: STAS domain-containing protein [Rhodococcus]AMY19795.1 Anti-sigma-F factor antagonist RsfB [Rhodococcus sp. PBTS 1]MBY6312091.1 STAS domain-containing protein [Rhodococcus kroppenstedtii]MBY6319825.1 STAS domain-containing protein [Rhodococcus kroppenstedtii]MBY6398508.1 STAS domain-containing protein [Rhodococcus kroppenstedtii]